MIKPARAKQRIWVIETTVCFFSFRLKELFKKDLLRLGMVVWIVPHFKAGLSVSRYYTMGLWVCQVRPLQQRGESLVYGRFHQRRSVLGIQRLLLLHLLSLFSFVWRGFRLRQQLLPFLKTVCFL